MREKRKHPVHTSEIVGKAARKFKFHEKMLQWRLVKKWEAVLGPAIALHARPLRWQRGTLIVRVEHAGWMQELSFLKPQLMEKLGKVLPENKLKAIRFELGEMPQLPSEIRRHSKAPPPRRLSAEETEFVEQAVAQISDPEIRDSARRAMTRGFAEFRK